MSRTPETPQNQPIADRPVQQVPGGEAVANVSEVFDKPPTKEDAGLSILGGEDTHTSGGDINLETMSTEELLALDAADNLDHLTDEQRKQFDDIMVDVRNNAAVQQRRKDAHDFGRRTSEKGGFRGVWEKIGKAATAKHAKRHTSDAAVPMITRPGDAVSTDPQNAPDAPKGKGSKKDSAPEEVPGFDSVGNAIKPADNVYAEEDAQARGSVEVTGESTTKTTAKEKTSLRDKWENLSEKVVGKQVDKAIAAQAVAHEKLWDTANRTWEKGYSGKLSEFGVTDPKLAEMTAEDFDDYIRELSPKEWDALGEEKQNEYNRLSDRISLQKSMGRELIEEATELNGKPLFGRDVKRGRLSSAIDKAADRLGKPLAELLEENDRAKAEDKHIEALYAQHNADAEAASAETFEPVAPELDATDTEEEYPLYPEAQFASKEATIHARNVPIGEDDTPIEKFHGMRAEAVLDEINNLTDDEWLEMGPQQAQAYHNLQNKISSEINYVDSDYEWRQELNATKERENGNEAPDTETGEAEPVVTTDEAEQSVDNETEEEAEAKEAQLPWGARMKARALRMNAHAQLLVLDAMRLSNPKNLSDKFTYYDANTGERKVNAKGKVLSSLVMVAGAALVAKSVDTTIDAVSNMDLNFSPNTFGPNPDLINDLIDKGREIGVMPAGTGSSAMETTTSMPTTSTGVSTSEVVNTTTPSTTTNHVLPGPATTAPTTTSEVVTTTTTPTTTGTSSSATTSIPTTSSSAPTAVAPPEATPSRIPRGQLPDAGITGNNPNMNSGISYSDAAMNLQPDSNVWDSSHQFVVESGFKGTEQQTNALTDMLKDYRLEQLGLTEADAYSMPPQNLPTPPSELMQQWMAEVKKS